MYLFTILIVHNFPRRTLLYVPLTSVNVQVADRLLLLSHIIFSLRKIKITRTYTIRYYTKVPLRKIFFCVFSFSIKIDRIKQVFNSTRGHGHFFYFFSFSGFGNGCDGESVNALAF